MHLAERTLSSERVFGPERVPSREGGQPASPAGFINNNDLAPMNSKAFAAIAKSMSLENLSVSYALLDNECLAQGAD
jgi:hypothetical protein